MNSLKGLDDKIAIVCVGYNRVKSMTRLLDSLKNATYNSTNIPLIISIDKSGCEQLYNLVEKFDWPYGIKKVIIQDEKLGLKKHIFKCGDLSALFRAVIILEDDLVVGPGFYSYVEQAVNTYENDSNIAEISLYKNDFNGFAGLPFENIQTGSDVFLMRSVTTWGQCFTRKMWHEFSIWYNHMDETDIQSIDMPEKIKKWEKAWSKYLYTYVLMNDKFVLYPNISLTSNFSDAGVHGGDNNAFVQVNLQQGIFLYRMPQVAKLAKYDIYYNNLELPQWLGIDSTKVVLDLYGYRTGAVDRSYLLTTSRLPFQIIKSYALNMRPIELNVKLGLQGEGIYLYDTATSEKNVFPSKSLELLKYFFCKYYPKDICAYCVEIIKAAIKSRVLHILK